MKKMHMFIALFFAAASIAFTPGCMVRGCLGLRMIHGSGKMQTVKKELPDFSKIRLSGTGRMVIMQGNKTAIEITSDDNIVTRISASVTGNTLKIRLPQHELMRPTKDIEYKIFLKELESVKISGSGVIICKKLETKKLLISASGSADIDMNLNADSLKVDISGSAELQFAGKVREQSVSISGSGSYDAEELLSRETDISISGSGDARIHTLDKLDVNVSGSGSVAYSGNPKVTQKISGVGKVRNIDE